MKIGICVDRCHAESYAAALRSGADYTELALNSFSDADEKEVTVLKKQTEDAGMFVGAYMGLFPWSGFRVTGNGVDWGKIDDYLEKVLTNTDILGGGIVVFGSSGARRLEDGDRTGKAQADILRLLRHHIVPAFERHDRICAIEPLSEDNLIHTVLDAVSYVNAVNHQCVRALADFYHTAVEKEDLSEYTNFGNAITHCHIASPSAKRHLCLPGDGDEEYYGRVFATLRNIGYHGMISLEGSGNPDEYAKSVSYLRQLTEKYGI